MKKDDIFITFPKTNIFFVILVFIFLVYQDISFSQNLVQDTLIISFKNMKNKEQKFIARMFEKQDVGLEISNINDLLEGNIIEVINSLTLEKKIEMGNKGKKLVDGSGASRIVDFFERKGII